jgi:uncharacterized damage-inducible protein DinB
MLPPVLGTPNPMPSTLVAARAAFDEALSSLLAIPDAALSTIEKPWPWHDDSAIDIRYGLYHLYEQLEKGQAAALRAGGKTTQAGVILGQTTAALWDLHGLLLPLGNQLDRDPGGGEWSIRQTLAHVVAVERSYASHTAYAVHRQRNDPSLPLRTPEDVYWQVPEEQFVEGNLAAIRQRMDEWHDVGVGWLREVDDDAALAARTIWAGFEVDVWFRLHRWPSHFREHTIQVEKTLAMLGHQPTEVARVVRVIAHAYGRLEGEAIARPGADGAALAAIQDAVERVRAHAGELLAAAG